MQLGNPFSLTSEAPFLSHSISAQCCNNFMFVANLWVTLYHPISVVLLTKDASIVEQFLQRQLACKLSQLLNFIHQRFGLLWAIHGCIVFQLLAQLTNYAKDY